MYTIKRSTRSVPMAMLHFFIRPVAWHLIKPRKKYPAGSPRLKPHRKARRRCHVLERQVAGIWTYELSPREQGPRRSSTPTNGPSPGPSSPRTKLQKPPPLPKISRLPPPNRKKLYYFAGGCWQSPPSAEHWQLCAELAVQLQDTTVTLVSYPLAPNCTAGLSLPLLVRWLKTVLEEADAANDEVTLMGDSAGGNIIVSLACLYLNKAETRSLRKLVVISPALDLGNTNPEQRTVERHDPILNIARVDATARAWADELDRHSSPLVSPARFADVSGLAKSRVRLYGVTGGWDVLTPDALVFRERCSIAGVKGEWLEWDKQMHCFPLAWVYGLQESKDALEWLLRVLRKDEDEPCFWGRTAGSDAAGSGGRGDSVIASAASADSAASAPSGI